MKDRIKLFIDYKGISPGDLATALDVQRSNISHILNGRNKPGAAFIEKILLVYPDLNARWLLTGTGNMFADTDNLNAASDKLIQKDSPEHIDEAPVKKEVVDDSNKTSTRKQSLNEDLDKVVLLFSDGTFTTYNPK